MKSRLLTLGNLRQRHPCGGGVDAFLSACMADASSPKDSLLIVDDPAWVWRFARHFNRGHIYWVATNLLSVEGYQIYNSAIRQKWIREKEFQWGDRAWRNKTESLNLQGHTAVIPLALFAHLYAEGMIKPPNYPRGLANSPWRM